MKGSLTPERGCDPQVEKHYFKCLPPILTKLFLKMISLTFSVERKKYTRISGNSTEQCVTLHTLNGRIVKVPVPI